MTEERLRAAEGWAGYPDRDPEAARLVCDLVLEVRRLQAAVVPDGVITGPPMSEQEAQALRERLSKYNGRRVQVMPVQIEYVPPFRGILDGITAETVYGVEV